MKTIKILLVIISAAFYFISCNQAAGSTKATKKADPHPCEIFCEVNFNICVQTLCGGVITEACWQCLQQRATCLAGCPQ